MKMMPIVVGYDLWRVLKCRVVDTTVGRGAYVRSNMQVVFDASSEVRRAGMSSRWWWG